MRDMEQANGRQNGSSPDPEFLDTGGEGGLRAPPGLTGWRKAWWWFDFIILVKLARLRFIGILALIGLVITQWDTLAAYYAKWTRPAGAADTGASSGIEYFCPMHPTIVRDTARDKCPICFMPLSKRAKGASSSAALPPGIVSRVQLSPYRVVLAGVGTWPVDFVPLAKEITAVGYIEFSERGQRTVSARVAGRIDKLFANETGKMVQADDDLALLYSQELLVTKQNLLSAKRSGNQDLLASARTRLALLGIDTAQIDEIMSEDQPSTQIRIRSPISGHVITKYVREGQYVEEGTPLYEVADLSTVWIQAQIYEDDLAYLPVGYEHGARGTTSGGLEVTATTRAFPNEPFHGKLAFVYPHVDQETRTVTVRFEVDNPGHRLRPGSTASVTLKVQPKDIRALATVARDAHGAQMLAEGRVLAIPESAVIDTGRQRIVYRQSSPNVFEGVQVALGPRMSDADGATFFPLLAGLDQGARIVTSGSFLVDAETRLNPAAGSIYFGGSGGASAGPASTSSVRPSTPEDPDAKIRDGLAKLATGDQALAAAQRFCPVLSASRLGSMGTPVKLVINGEPVFLCCTGCKDRALGDAPATMAKAKKLREQAAEAPAPLPERPTAPAAQDALDPSEAEIRAGLAKLAPDDQKRAEAQRFCAVLPHSRLGSMGVPLKLTIDGQAVFLCCDGCQRDAQAKPEETLTRARRLRELSERTRNE